MRGLFNDTHAVVVAPRAPGESIDLAESVEYVRVALVKLGAPAVARDELMQVIAAETIPGTDVDGANVTMPLTVQGKEGGPDLEHGSKWPAIVKPIQEALEKDGVL